MALRPARSLESAFLDDRFPDQNGTSDVEPTVREENGAIHLAYRRMEEQAECAVITFVQAGEWSYGGPNDEAVAKRNLWGLSLRPYEFYYVVPAPEDGMTEWLVTFHDGCFRIIARDVAVLSRSVVSDSPADALDVCVGEGANRVL
jgi:hypothetical protein